MLPVVQRLGDWEVLEQLGRGGLGTVFRAVHVTTRQEVALKVLAAADERARRRLILEVRALTRLRHPSIVSILDAGDDRGRLWLAMELVRGRTLQERLDREGPLEPREAARVALAVTTALTHAHAQGVLHRDLKPANVLLPEDGGDPKLVDFGLAGFTTDLSQSRLTHSGTLMGSPGYWAPEQASGRRDLLGPATDVHGLGALLHAALTGRPPFEGATLPELLVATENRRPSPPGAGPALDGIVLRCLEKAPEARFPSAEALTQALTRFLDDDGRPTRSHRVAPLALAASAVLVAALVVAGFLPSRQAEAPLPEQTTADRHGTDPQAEALCRQATARMTAGDAAGALPGLEAAAARDPFHVFCRGRGHFHTGDYARARADFDVALARDPTRAGAHADRAAARLGLGDVQGALEDCERALALNPRDVIAYANRAHARSLQGDVIGGIADYDRAAELDPKNAGILLSRAMLRYGVGDKTGAIADCDASLALDPSQPRAYRHRALCKSDLDDPRGAIADLDRAIELAPVADHFFLRAMQRAKLQDYAAAEKDATRTIELEERNAAAHFNRGTYRSHLRNTPGALADFERALALEPDATWAKAARDWVAQARAGLTSSPGGR